MKIASIAIAALLASTPAMATEPTETYDLGVLKAASEQAYDMANVAWSWSAINGKSVCLDWSQKAMRNAATASQYVFEAERQMVIGQQDAQESIKKGMAQAERSMSQSAVCLPDSYVGYNSAFLDTVPR